ncbi:hypothetical protein [Methylobacterium ajmalii]|uniref:hypothetical protein n=1 Tax=Methylobacterium ajmalii TaxID=2738439 RepID=UPI002F35F557
MSTATLPKNVTFLPGPKAKERVTAEVLRQEGAFYVTKDAAGKERKIRPGACTVA